MTREVLICVKINTKLLNTVLKRKRNWLRHITRGINELMIIIRAQWMRIRGDKIFKEVDNTIRG